MPSKSRHFNFGMRVAREEGFNLEEEGHDMTMIDIGSTGSVSMWIMQLWLGHIASRMAALEMIRAY